MNELKNTLNRLSEKMLDLERNPSELTKDNLLAEVRAFYDQVKSVQLQVVEIQATMEPLSEPEEATGSDISKVEAESEAEPKPVMVQEPVVVEQQVEPETELTEPEPAPTPVVEAVKPEPAAPKKETLIGKAEQQVEQDDRNILAGKLNHKPLEDLRTGIPLNEKFGIIRSLFKGNATDFGDAVLKLNNAANTEEMDHYLTLLAQRFGWDMESEAYRSFFVYVERKMMTLQPSDANSDK